MTETLWTIVGMGIGVYGLRLAGLSLRGVALPTALERGLRFTPVALLSAIVAVSLGGQVSADPARGIAALGAALVAYRTGQMWACILTGLAMLWLLRAW